MGAILNHAARMQERTLIRVRWHSVHTRIQPHMTTSSPRHRWLLLLGLLILSVTWGYT